MATLLSHDSFEALVQDNWKPEMSYETNIHEFTNAAFVWNRNVFGTYRKKKQRILNRMHGIHEALAERPNPFLDDLLQCLWWEYEVILFEEESFWAQKSRCKWLSQGDRNIHYFHFSTLARRRRNKILALKDDHGSWVHDAEMLKTMTRDFFMSLYCGNCTCDRFPLTGCFPTIFARD